VGAGTQTAIATRELARPVPTADGLLPALELVVRSGELIHRAGAIAAASGVVLERSLHPVLFALRARALTIGQLADVLGVRSPTASRHVAVLATKKLVALSTDPGDARLTIVALTDGGRRAVAALADGWSALFDEVLARWNERDRARFAADLARFAADWRALADAHAAGRPAHEEELT
jgi:DNA-binding MarR family transcriptional regulator